MAASDKLFALIKSLTKAEKRVFKLDASRHGGEKHYLKLFALIDRQTTYDEAAIKDAFQGTKVHARFSREKNHLYELILKSMSQYQARKSIQTEVHALCTRIRFLFGKGLYKQCIPLLRKARRIAEKHELYTSLFEINDLKKRVWAKGAYGNVKKTALEISDEQAFAFRGYNNISIYSELFDELTLQRLLLGRVRRASEQAQAEEILQRPALQDLEQANTVESKFLFLHTHFSYHELLGNWPQAQSYAKSLLDLLEANPAQHRIKFEQYIELYYLYLKCTLRMAQFDAYEGKWTLKDQFYKDVQRFKDIPSTPLYQTLQNDNLEGWYRTNYYHFHFNYYAHVYDFREILGMSGEIESHLRKYQKMESQDSTIFSLNISAAAFLIGEYQQSNFWLNKILNSNVIDARSDIYSFARIFGLLVHYEIGNYDLLEYISNSAYRFLHKLNRFHKVEKTLYDFMHKEVINLTTKREKTAAFTNLHDKLSKLMDDPNEKRIFEIFNFFSWCEAHMEHKPITETRSYLRNQEILTRYGRKI